MGSQLITANGAVQVSGLCPASALMRTVLPVDRLDDFSRCIIVWKLRTTMKEDVTDMLTMAQQTSGCKTRQAIHGECRTYHDHLA